MYNGWQDGILGKSNHIKGSAFKFSFQVFFTYLSVFEIEIPVLLKSFKN